MISGPERRHGAGSQQRSDGQGADHLRACAEVLPEPRPPGAGWPITDVYRRRGRSLDYNRSSHLEGTGQTVHATSCLPGQNWEVHPKLANDIWLFFLSARDIFMCRGCASVSPQNQVDGISPSDEPISMKAQGPRWSRGELTMGRTVPQPHAHNQIDLKLFVCCLFARKKNIFFYWTEQLTY